MLFLVVVTACGYAQVKKSDTLSSKPLSGCGGGFLSVYLAKGSQSVCPYGTAMFIAEFLPPGFRKGWQLSTDSGLTWNTIPNTTGYVTNDDTLLVPNVTPLMNNYQYRCSYSCSGSVYSSAAILTVATVQDSIIAQPSDILNVCAGTTADFIVTATGNSLTYQWQLSIDGGNIFSDIGGANSSDLHFNNVTKDMNNNKYRCIVSSVCSSTLTSSIATITVNQNSAEITSQPTTQSVCQGVDVATFSLATTGTAVRYQWQMSNNGSPYTDVNADTSSSLVLSGLTFNNYDVYPIYRCKISSGCKDTIYSNSVTLKYYTKPNIILQPTDVITCISNIGTFTFKAGISGLHGDDITAQWERSTDGGQIFVAFPIGKGTASDVFSDTASIYPYGITDIEPIMDKNIFRCHFYNQCFSQYSDTAILKLSLPLVISKQPINDTACTDGQAIFNVQASGLSLAYIWQVSTDSGEIFTSIPNGNSPTLSVPAYLTSNGYQYRCYVVDCNTNALFTNSVILNIASIWNGSVSSAWENPLNWSCNAIPDSNTNVIINSGTVVLSSNASVRSVTVDPTASFTIVSPFTLTITH